MYAIRPLPHFGENPQAGPIVPQISHSGPSHSIFSFETSVLTTLALSGSEAQDLCKVCPKWGHLPVRFLKVMNLKNLSSVFLALFSSAYLHMSHIPVCVFSETPLFFPAFLVECCSSLLRLSFPGLCLPDIAFSICIPEVQHFRWFAPDRLDLKARLCPLPARWPKTVYFCKPLSLSVKPPRG